MNKINCLFLPILLFTQGYLWPTTASKVLTSSYCESRSNRFHTGVDISTWNKEGYKCQAIEDGYVFRVWVQPYGYGKALYLKLKDGRIAVYAHLSKFNSKVEAFLKSKQKKELRYNQNLFFKPNEFPFKKGDVVAYTGSTGIGVPHLHFEIREHAEKTLHPLQFYPKYTDKIKPRIKQVWLKSLSKKNTFMYKAVNLNKVVTVDDSVGFLIDSYDPTAIARIGTGIYKTTLSIDSVNVFESTFDSMKFSENKYFNLDRELFFKKYKNKYIQRLYKDPKTKLNWAYKEINNGIISIEDTLIHNFVISVEDFSGNKKIVKGKLKKSKTEKPFTELRNNIFSNQHFVFNGKIAFTDSTSISINDSTNLVEMYAKNSFQKSKISLWKTNTQNIYTGDVFTYKSERNGLFYNSEVMEWKMKKHKFPKANYQSDIYHFVPLNLELNRPLKLRTNNELEKNVGVFVWNLRKSKWDYEKTRIDGDKRGIFTERSANIYTLIKDTVPPIVRFTKWDSLSSTYDIWIEDKRSGIRDEKNYELWSGDREIIAEYDYEDHILKIDKVDIKRNGILKLVVRDNLKNETHRQIFIKNYP